MGNITHPPRSWWKRTPARLSVRMSMLLIVVAACGLGWVVHRAREQRLTVQAILARGGTVEYDYQYDTARDRRLSGGKSWRPAWLQAALGDDYFHHVVCVGLDEKHVATDADLALVAGFGRLRLLYLGGGRITDDGLSQLGDLTELRLLILWGNPISGDGLKHLRRLKGLKHLDLSNTRVADGRLVGLEDLTGLERLDIPNNPQLTGSFLQYVADLPNLNSLVLRGCGITDSALGHLEHSNHVQALMLDRTRVTDAGLAHLRGLSSLRALDLGQTAVTDSGLARVREWFPLAGVQPSMPGK